MLIGEYDNDPTLTYGIEDEEYSKILTPWCVISGFYDNVGTVAAQNYRSGSYNDTTVADNILLVSDSTLDYHDYVYAVWAEAASPVPTPASIILLGSGMIGIFSLKRKRSITGS